MDIEIEEIDPYRVRWQDARAIAEFMSLSFAGEPFHSAIWGKDFDFLNHPPVGAAHQRAYQKFLYLDTFRVYRFLRDPAHRCFWAKTMGPDAKPVGMIRWTVPATRQLRPSLWHRLRLWWIDQQFKWLNWWYFGSGKSPNVPSAAMLGFFDRLEIALGIDKHDEAENAELRLRLAHKTEEELTTTPYPIQELYWCETMTVDPAFHRRGIGSRLFRGSARLLEPYEPEFSDPAAPGSGASAVRVRAPQQFGLLASPMGIKLYESLGFRRAGEYIENVDGDRITARLFIHSGPLQ